MSNKLSVILKLVDLFILREIKNEDEIKYIKKVCEIVDVIFYYIVDFIKVGMIEK